VSNAPIKTNPRNSGLKLIVARSNRRPVVIALASVLHCAVGRLTQGGGLGDQLRTLVSVTSLVGMVSFVGTVLGEYLGSILIGLAGSCVLILVGVSLHTLIGGASVRRH
jgi:hypothetical protein